jgi:dTDP-4-amino-4,6-dideoxygalactose transaminase
MMKTVNDLAALGGKPWFEQPLHVGRPNVPDKQAVLARIGEALDRHWLTNDGPLVRELEQQLADYLKVPHCVAMANGTVAMEVLARALNLSGEVVVPGFTFIATAHAFAWMDIEPIFCDVDPETHCIDVASAESMISPRTSAIVAAHLWGMPCDVGALAELSNRSKLPVIYDAAHGFGATSHGTRIGNFGRAEVFSFHATKFFNTFEGGAVTTADAELAARIRLLRNFGFAGYDDVVGLGTNAKLSEAHAAMGLSLIERLDNLMDRNAATWAHYSEGLRGNAALRLLGPRDGYGSNYQYVVCEVTDASRLTRDQLLNVLWQENVRARRYFFPGCHRTPPYIMRPQRALPVTEQLADRVLVLPAGAAITEAEIDGVVALLNLAFEHAGPLKQKLPARLPAGAFKA